MGKITKVKAVRTIRYSHFWSKKQTEMGKVFGNLGVRVRGIITYSLSPFEQRAFAGVISHGVPNTFRRFRSQIFRVAPPFIVGYMIYDWARRRTQQLSVRILLILNMNLKNISAIL